VSYENSVTIIGLGYVGLPLACEAQFAGFNVIGLDINEQTVSNLNQGISHIDDVTDTKVKEMLALGFRATMDFASISTAKTVVICVPTPLAVNGEPDLSFVKSAGIAVGANLRPNQLVILESTSYPGTTEEVLIPLLEQSGLRSGIDFSCAFSPERIDPGNTSFSIGNTPKVVGGIDKISTSRAYDFYNQFVSDVVEAKGVREAELTKLIENTYRHVNIALMNELVKFCRGLDIDLWDAIRCAGSKPFGYEPFYPGPGVGGHCIPIDPNYLAYRVRTHLDQSFRFIELAREINDGMPTYVARRAQELLNEQGKPVNGSSVLLLGVTYKANISDQRESPAKAVATALTDLGAQVMFHDPFVEKWAIDGVDVRQVEDLEDGLLSADLMILLQAHHEYLSFDGWDDGVPILDTRGALETVSAQRM